MDKETLFDRELIPSGAYSCVRATVYLRDNCWSVLVRYGFTSVVLIILSVLHFWLPSAWTVARPLSAVLPTVVFAAIMVHITVS